MYSVNTKDEDIIKVKKQIQEIVLSHQHILQMHGFNMDKEEKSIRFDIVVSFNAKNRRDVYRDVIEDVQKNYPDYQIKIAMDTDFSEA